MCLSTDLAAEQDGLGLTIRLTSDYMTGKGELEAALSSMAQRRKAAEAWATQEHPERADWAVGKWAMALRPVTGRRHGSMKAKGNSAKAAMTNRRRGAVGGVSQSGLAVALEDMHLPDELSLRVGEVVRLTAGLPNKYWSGVKMTGATGDFPASEMVVLEKAIARRGFEPMPSAPKAMYSNFLEGAMVVIVESKPGAKWWQGFVLDKTGMKVMETDSGGQVPIKLLPRESVTKESDALFEKLVPRAMRWGETASGKAQRAALMTAQREGQAEEGATTHWALSTAGVLAYATRNGWERDGEDMEAAAAQALMTLGGNNGGVLPPSMRILELGSQGAGLWRVSQAIHEAGVGGGEVALADARLAEQRAGLQALRQEQATQEAAGEYGLAAQAALTRQRRIESLGVEWLHGGDGGQTVGYLSDERAVFDARQNLSVSAQAHAAERELATGSVDRLRLEEQGAADIAEIRLLLSRDKVVIGREIDASLIQQAKKAVKARNDADAALEAAEAVIAGRIAEVEADLATNILQIEQVCAEEVQRAEDNAAAYIEMNMPALDEAAAKAVEVERAKIAGEMSKKSEVERLAAEEVRQKKEAKREMKRAQSRKERAEFIAKEQAEQ